MSPFTTSLLPISLLSVPRMSTRADRISSAPPRPGDRGSSSVKVNSFSRTPAATRVCRRSRSSWMPSPSSTPVHTDMDTWRQPMG